MLDVMRSAVDSARPWALLMTGEVALVVPVLHGEPQLPVVVATGDRASVVVTPAAVLRAVLASRADAFVLVHTHPEDLPPSGADAAVTRRLVAASSVVGVRMLGHIVLSPSRTYDCFAA